MVFTGHFQIARLWCRRGQCTALRWDVRNVQAVYLDGEGVPGVSARDVCPGGTTTYTLVVTKLDGGQDSRQVTVEVRNAPPPAVEWPRIERFSVSANEIQRGQCVSFEWRTDNADGVNLLVNSGSVAGQEVFHLHVHVVPRYTDDPGLRALTDRTPGIDLDEVAAALTE